MDTTQEKTLYELSYHLLSTVEEGAVATELDKIRAAVAKYNGGIVKEQEPERFNLAYTIVKKLGGKNERHDTSYFGWLFFEASPEEAHSINTELQSVESILRYLLIGTSREALTPQQRRVVVAPKKQTARKTTIDPDAPKMTKEDMDKEIESLVVE